MYNIDAEKCVVGSLLVNPDGCSEILSFLSPEDFFDRYLANVYQKIKEEWETGGEISVVTIADKLGNGNYSILSELLNSANISRVAVEAAKIVKNKAILRGIDHRCRLILDTISDATRNYEDVIEDVEKIIFDISSYYPEDIKQLTCYIDDVERRLIKKEIIGLRMGFKDLDDYTGGLRGGELVVIAARPSVGKTALALNIAYNLSLENIPSCIFSLEMSGIELAFRFIAIDKGIPIYDIRTGKVNTEGLTALFGGIPIYVNDSSLITTSQMRSILRRHRDIRIVIVDYIQLLQTEKKAESRVAEVSKIARDLKCLAREFNIPVIAISQLSRAVEQRQDKRPQLSDLRESGAIEQEADIVLLLYREDYYKKDNKDNTVPVEIDIAKNRNGPLETITLLFEKKTNRFLEMPEFNLGGPDEAK